MKIVIINGSPRVNGLTAGILHTLERSLLTQGVFHKAVFSFGIRPFVMKKGEKYRGVIAKWKEYGI